MVPFVLILARLIGVLQGVEEQERQRFLMQSLIRLQQAPQAEFRLVNRSGKPLDAVLVLCASDPKRPQSFRQFSRRVGPYGRKPTLLHRTRWPERFVLVSITTVGGKKDVEQPLNYTCQPGGRVLVVVDENGKVSAQVDK